MFDIGFAEMMLLALIALVVIGPKQLPGFARTLGYWIGKGRRVISEVKADIKQEMDADELKSLTQAKQDLEEVRSNLSSLNQNILDTSEKHTEDKRQSEMAQPTPTKTKD